jgi:hypothetical protein
MEVIGVGAARWPVIPMGRYDIYQLAECGSKPRAKKTAHFPKEPFRLNPDQPMLIESRNSMLFPVFLSLFNINSIASTGGTPVKARRNMTTRLYSSG